MNKNKKIIGVIGLGMVGGMVYRWFKSQKYDVIGYDKFKKNGGKNPDDLNKADIVFLCLPTPHSDSEDMGVSLASFEEIIEKLKKPKMFVIKSTVPPGTTEILQEKFKGRYFFHNPEFLTEATAWKDFSRPTLQLIGYTKKSKKFANDILKILPKAKYANVLSATATEIFKFARNAFFATKVIFANQIYDLCEAWGVSYDDMKKAMSAEPWICGNHLEVVHKGYRGFGGKCLPKDLKTLIKAFHSKKVRPSLFEAVDSVNTELLENQKLMNTLKELWLENKS